MIPKYEEIMLPFLKFISDEQEHSLSETHDALAKEFKLTDEELKELLPSGQQPIFRNRLGWARTYLKKAGLVTSPKRAHFKISDIGLALLNEKPTEITSKFLTRYDDFVGFQSIKKNKTEKGIGVQNQLDIATDQTPGESLEYAYQKLHSTLSKELLSIVKTCTPSFFEKLVIDLLITMGYGGSRKEAGKAKKGIFITTSSFPKSVYEFVGQVEYKIILIDGERLANLMIEHSVGLSTVSTYHVKSIDSDYFEEN
ncbi:MAG: restriction endonuclease [Proteobacteria bacterium]|nr:restriction endonuclease [Pseudomonadota bacterium]MBU1058245.1 restriction endonuclease [Pseudomonadota bacterium]